MPENIILLTLRLVLDDSRESRTAARRAAVGCGGPTDCDETFPKPHTLAATVCGTGTVRVAIVPKPHTLAATVCGTGTMRAVIVPKPHTLAAAEGDKRPVPSSRSACPTLRGWELEQYH